MTMRHRWLKRPRTITVRLFLAALGLVAFAPREAHAYIDPGTGSFLIQGLIAAIVGAGLALKLYWRRIKSALTGKPIPEDNSDPDA